MLAQEEVKEDINTLDLQQVMADHVSGKSTLTPIATVYAETDESGEVELLDGIELARSLFSMDSIQNFLWLVAQFRMKSRFGLMLR